MVSALTAGMEAMKGGREGRANARQAHILLRDTAESGRRSAIDGAQFLLKQESKGDRPERQRRPQEQRLLCATTTMGRTERTERKEGGKRKLNESENEVKTSSVVDFVPAMDMAKSRQEDLD